MNTKNLHIIFSNYIAKFEEINNPTHMEYYKWAIAQEFRPKMDEALASSLEEFPAKVLAVRKLTDNLVDNFTQPFYGLVEIAKKEPEIVRKMFLDLFQAASLNIQEKQERVDTFLIQSHALRNKHFPDSYLYKNDVHAVTALLFLYHPDSNYIFKSSHAKKFADCIEFYQDWGSGDAVKLEVYFRMCDILVEEIKNYPALLECDAGRFTLFENSNVKLHPDTQKHILAFDLIYGCETHNLFNGTSFTPLKTSKRQLLQERKAKAKALYQDLEEKKQKLKNYKAALGYLREVFSKGKKIQHQSFGEGEVQVCEDTTMRVLFNTVGEKILGIALVSSNGIVTTGEKEFEQFVAVNNECLRNGKSYERDVQRVEKELLSYLEYLD